MTDSTNRWLLLIVVAAAAYMAGKVVGGWRLLTAPIDEYHALRMKYEDIKERYGEVEQ